MGTGATLSAGAFKLERDLYLDPDQPLGKFLPQMLRIAEGPETGLRDAEGGIMPPCIVMEKGEALDTWIENSGEKIDMFTGLQARPCRKNGISVIIRCPASWHRGWGKSTPVCGINRKSQPWNSLSILVP